jgi:CubicO group peptidase (beta-lactamase class C family)
MSDKKSNLFLRIIKSIFKWVFYIIILINIFILGSGKLYLYKTIWYNLPTIHDNNKFEERIIHAGTPQEFPNADDYCKTAMPSLLSETLEKLKSVAFLVIIDDSVRYEKYWDGYGKASLTNSFSMAKTFVSILIGIAIDEGKIKSVDEPVADFLPQFKEGMGQKLTIRHLLTMSSGLNWNESYINPLSITTEAYYGTNIPKLVASLKVVDEPGKVWKYLSGNTLVLAAILEKATGMKVSNYATEKLWKPLGANNDAQWSLDKKEGEEKAYCCIYSNARDFARIGELYLHHGNWNGKQIISEDYVNNSIKPADLKDDEGNNIDHYGYAWWLINVKGHKVFYARGILGQYVFVIPDKKMVAVRLGNKRGQVKGKFIYTDIEAYIEGVLEMYP